MLSAGKISPTAANSADPIVTKVGNAFVKELRALGAEVSLEDVKLAVSHFIKSNPSFKLISHNATSVAGIFRNLNDFTKKLLADHRHELIANAIQYNSPEVAAQICKAMANQCSEQG